MYFFVLFLTRLLLWLQLSENNEKKSFRKKSFFLWQKEACCSKGCLKKAEFVKFRKLNRLIFLKLDRFTSLNDVLIYIFVKEFLSKPTLAILINTHATQVKPFTTTPPKPTLIY